MKKWSFYLEIYDFRVPCAGDFLSFACYNQQKKLSMVEI